MGPRPGADGGAERPSRLRRLVRAGGLFRAFAGAGECVLPHRGTAPRPLCRPRSAGLHHGYLGRKVATTLLRPADRPRGPRRGGCVAPPDQPPSRRPGVLDRAGHAPLVVSLPPRGRDPGSVLHPGAGAAAGEWPHRRLAFLSRDRAMAHSPRLGAAGVGGHLPGRAAAALPDLRHAARADRRAARRAHLRATGRVRSAGQPRRDHP